MDCDWDMRSDVFGKDLIATRAHRELDILNKEQGRGPTFEM